MKPNLYISTGSLIVNLMIADGQSKLETDRLLELGRFMHRRLRENGAWKTYGCVFLDMRAQTINAAMRYLSDYFAQSDGTKISAQKVGGDL